MNRKVCPECNSNLFQKDNIRNETYCLNCGLVLIAPAVHGIVFPGFKVVPRKKALKVNIKVGRNVYFHISYNLI